MRKNREGVIEGLSTSGQRSETITITDLFSGKRLNKEKGRDHTSLFRSTSHRDIRKVYKGTKPPARGDEGSKRSRQRVPVAVWVVARRPFADSRGSGAASLPVQGKEMVNITLMGSHGVAYLLQLILSLLELEVPSDGRVLPCKLGNLCTVEVVH